MNNIKNRIVAITEQIESRATAELYYTRGKLYWRLGDRAAAMTDFNSAVALDPTSPARIYLNMANDIMDFYNTDLYNP